MIKDPKFIAAKAAAIKEITDGLSISIRTNKTSYDSTEIIVDLNFNDEEISSDYIEIHEEG